jgi:Tol biopolymer transport system component
MRALVNALALVTGCTWVFGLEPPQQSRSDANALDAVDGMGDAPAPGTWLDVHLAFTTTLTADDPTLTADMLEMYFDNGSDIYVTKRKALIEAWTVPTPVAELNSVGNDGTPRVSGNGLILVLSSNRTGSQATDLWYSSRASRITVWDQPQIVGMINSSANDVAGTGTADTLNMMIASDRPGGAGGFDIYLTTRITGGEFQVPVLVPELNTGALEASPHLTSDGTEVYFYSTRGASGDLYHSVRTGTTWSVPQPIIELNTPSSEEDPWVSADGHHMFFSSDRGGSGKRIYEASR